MSKFDASRLVCLAHVLSLERAFKGCPQYLFMKNGFYESDTPCKIRQYDLKNKGFKSVDYYTT